MSVRAAVRIVAFALGFGAAPAWAQTAPVSYWLPNWPMGFAGAASADASTMTYGDFPGFDGGQQRTGFFMSRYDMPGSWFSRNAMGFGGVSAFGGFSGLTTEGVQFGYNFRTGDLPVKLFGGIETMKSSRITAGALAPFESGATTLPGYSAHAGIAIQPASNLSLSLGVGYTQQGGRIDSDINSPLLPGASPVLGGFR